MANFLDTTGLTRVWDKCKNILVPIQNRITDTEIDSLFTSNLEPDSSTENTSNSSVAEN